jgi:hypothetical protein
MHRVYSLPLLLLWILFSFSPARAQDCQVGNLGQTAGQTGADSDPIAVLLAFDPASECSACGDWIRITTVHAPSWVLGPCEQLMRAILWTADLTNPTCPVPDALLCAGEFVPVTMPEAGTYSLSLPLDCAVRSDHLYFMGIEIAEACAPGGGGFWTEPAGCVGYASYLPGYNWFDVGIAYKFFADASCMESTAVEEASWGAIKVQYRLHANEPNPFILTTAIRYELPTASPVQLAVYDATGRAVRVLVDGAVQQAGSHVVHWDGHGADGQTLAAGVYFYRLEAGAYAETRRAVLIR